MRGPPRARGALDVDAPIGTWLPELPSWSRTICSRQLIHHTAGLPSTDAVWERMESTGELDWTSDGVIAALTTMHDLEHAPGTAYAYSGVGYICLARIIERLSGSSLDRLARARLFDPLGMQDTILWSGPQASPPHAALVQPQRSPAPLSLGDGGLWTTVRDLLRWNDALLEDRLGITTTLHTPGTLEDGTPLDYAWACGSPTSQTNGSKAMGEAGRARQPGSYAFRIAASASPRLRSTATSSGWSCSRRRCNAASGTTAPFALVVQGQWGSATVRPPQEAPPETRRR